MIFTCERAILVEVLSNVQKAVAQKSNIAALEGVLISAKKNKLEFCGYNTELGITTSLAAKTEKDGKIVLNAYLLTEIIRKLPEETVRIEILENLTAKIKSGQSEFELLGIDPKDFPKLPEIDGESTLELPAPTLKSMIRQTVFAVADTDAKPIHTGTLFEIKSKELSLVSVDGYRLALRREAIKEDLELNFVVPGKTLREVLKLLPDDEESAIKISAGMRHVVFEIGNYSVISRLLEGEFLDYKATVPESSKTQAQINTKAFVDSIERVSLLITDRLKSPVRCVLSSDEVHISCATTIGKASDEIPSKITGEKELEIAFNNKYMIDALRNTDTDEVTMHLNGALSPIKILPKEGNAFLFLVLPVRIKAE